ncbi:hypothetical protein QOZ80_7BG0608200 [Eleusine coracana subsp. coracana]|nr:hypothetical protein QOZ80_7BG0608200 [Eleusine coracana subsp. coracana]
MDQTQLDLGPHSAEFTGQGDDLSFASTAALHGVFGGLRPPRPTPTISTKLRRRSFVPPAPRPTAPAPPRSSAPAPPRLSAPAPPIIGGTRRQLSFSIPAVPPALARQASSSSLFPMSDLTEQPSSRCHAVAWEAFEATVDNNMIPIQNPIFDWTPTSMTSNHSEDTRPSTSSQYFTNLMTQDQDADLELLMQPDPTPAIVAKGPSKRGTNYSHYEDIQLYKSWLNISNDPIIETDQSGKTYWERIARDFHQNIYLERTTDSLEHHCGVIIRDCMKFHGYFEEVQRRHQSGIPKQEHLLQAQARYAKNSKGKNCPFIHCWLVVRHSEKFEALEMNKRPGKSRDLNLSGEINGSQQQDGGE